jgi:hypothetical protein
MELMEGREEQMREKYCNPSEAFSHKMDELLNALNRVRLIRK